jgi:excisionase family DNA binding protein
MEPLLHDVREVTELTKISRTRVFEEIAAGRMKSVLVGKRRLIPHQALLDYVEQLGCDVQSEGVA